jgi:hypothetical protein
MSFNVGSNTYLAAVTASGSAALNISGGSGLPTGAGGGSGGGGSTPTGSAGLPNSSVLSVQGISGGTPESVSIAALPPLAAGSNAIGSVNVSNFPSTQPISASALPLPSGAATSTAQTSVETSPGTSASTAITVQGSASGVAIPVTGTLSASVGGFTPGGAYASPLSVSTTSASVALPTGTTVVVYNTGSSTAFVKLGTAGVTATTANDQIPSGGWLALTVGPNTYLAAITASGSTSLNLSGGAGLLTGSGGGGEGGSVTVSGALPAGSNTIGGVTQTSGPWTINQTQTGGATLGAATAWGTAPSGNVAGVNADVLSLPSTLVANRGISTTQAMTIQGATTGIAVPIAQSTTSPLGFSPWGAYSSPLSVSTTSANVALPSGAPYVNIYNTGTAPAYWQMGASSSVTATTSDDVIQPGAWVSVANVGQTYLAAITASGTATLNISGGSGFMTGAGGGASSGGGSVTISGTLPAFASTPTFNLGTLNGAATAANQPTVAAAGSTTSGQSGNLDLAAVTTSAPTYTTGQSNFLSLNTSGGLRVDGSGVTQPVSMASAPTGASTSANQTNVQSSPGTSASTAITIQGSASGVAVPVTGSIAISTYDSGAIRVSATPGSSSHAAGVSVGGLLSVPIARINGGSGIITSAMLWTSWGSTQTYVLRVWQKNPTNSTCTDGTAFVSSATDDANLIGPGPVSVLLAAPANTTGDAKTYAYLAPLSWDYKNSDGTTTQNVYACLVTNGADTPGASATLSLTMSGPQN